MTYFNKEPLVDTERLSRCGFNTLRNNDDPPRMPFYVRQFRKSRPKYTGRRNCFGHVYYKGSYDGGPLLLETSRILPFFIYVRSNKVTVSRRNDGKRILPYPLEAWP